MAKSPQASRTISEAAEAAGAPQHVLRFWETKFPFVTPVKRAGGCRFYRPQDVVILKAIRRLLHEGGLTIKGVQRLHKEQGLAALAAYGVPGSTFVLDAGEATAAGPLGSTASSAIPQSAQARLQQLLTELETVRSRLDAVLAR